ncbi:methylglyoxal reductase (NADPH-dependent) gre2 [Apiotrichum porosum]|uniref:Methylglyoxal reductase (NADPH-dependent) gre2 n=1 Tax=Apiotrichum porosum TaxID=105984 RepID=A0A427XDA0_9TREE|nr:methylglyoxal reductase (NADPH-dependent) gre2 [Apiotrichum porosum]RSH76694.1 methylglyoxal reductase (NADPH-dependent) gre2 [Apiotrichum porosum]
MPAVPPGSLVLLTGASGFIATHTVQAFLDAGYPVRGTVRSKDKGEYLANLFKGSKVPFEYIIVEDIGKSGAFDEAVKDVVGVAHTASPFHFKATNPEELIRPAVDGTVGVLKSIQKHNPNVKRVVITSSVAAIRSGAPSPAVYTEKDWNEQSTENVKKLGSAANPSDKYQASKTLAEKAFWKFIEDEKPSFDGATIHPPLTMGPVIQPLGSIEQINTSNGIVLSWFRDNHKQDEIPPSAPFNWVDARDVAQAHVRALAVPEAGGERFITSAGPAGPNDYVLAFERFFPDRTTYPKGNKAEVATWHAKSDLFDGSKAERVLGIKYHQLDESVKDTIDSLVKRYNV